jgi:acyl-CoA synthetase (AMP-forming)/AMP-acid ligase II
MIILGGLPSDKWGELVAALDVSNAEHPTTDALVAFAADRLAPFKPPRRLQFVDALRNALGEGVKRELVGGDRS